MNKKIISCFTVASLFYILIIIAGIIYQIPFYLIFWRGIIGLVIGGLTGYLAGIIMEKAFNMKNRTRPEQKENINKEKMRDSTNIQEDSAPEEDTGNTVSGNNKNLEKNNDKDFSPLNPPHLEFEENDN